jgi:ABC-type transport system involved in multi-copper enzyme maturation permease subunit
MTINWTRVGAIWRKELTEYRRNGSIVSSMGIVPIVFLLAPLIEIFSTSPTALAHGDRLLYMLGTPAVIPAVIAAYAIAGERQQGTLEPVLTTPVRREELLLGKALASLVPSLIVSYVEYGLVLAVIELFASRTAASAVLRGSEIVAQIVFTPLIAGWSIWAGMAISTRARDIRVAQQLGTLVSLPTFALAALISFGAITPSLGLALGLGALLVVLDVAGWWVTSKLFDRERLILGTQG